jgi:dsDNA-specific endonuclease/ATPase MutS2
MRSLEEAHPLFADQQKSLDVLEWPQLLAEVINRCPSVYGQSAWKTQVFFKEIDVLQKTQDEVACLMRILQRFGEPTHTPTGEFRSSLPALDTLNKSGRLSLLDFMDLYHGLHHGRHYINHVLKYRTAVSPQKTPFA